MIKRFVLAADTEIGLRSGLSANVAGTFFNVHSSARLDGIFIVARNILVVWWAFYLEFFSLFFLNVHLN